jgi:hypothetical protein
MAWSPASCNGNFQWTKKFTGVLAGFTTQIYGPNPNRFGVGFCTQGNSLLISFGTDDGVSLGIRSPSTGAAGAFMWFKWQDFGAIVAEAWYVRAVAGAETCFSAELLWIPSPNEVTVEGL